MKGTIFVSFLLLLTSLSQAQELTPSQQNGKRVFDDWCSPCHAAVGGDVFGSGRMVPPPGTAALAVKYKGDLPAVLEERTDLQPIFIETVVRGGFFGMPITRKTEVSDAELDDIIDYLTRPRQ